MDLQSILGYQEGSPYATNPYLDINSGTIDMSNTPIDLMGIDNLGNKQLMKANTKNPYIYEGSRVREIPIQIPRQKKLPISIKLSPGEISASYNNDNKGVGFGLDLSRNYVGAHANIPFLTGGPTASKAAEMLRDGTAQGHALTGKQKHYFQALAHGWHPSKQGGGSLKDLYNYLFEEDSYDDKENPDNDNTAPTDEQVNNYMQTQPDPDEELAMSMVSGDNMGPGMGNPYMAQATDFNIPAGIQTKATKKVAAAIPAKASYAPGEAARYALNFYEQKGLPKHVAAGIVGNLIQESGNFRPDVITDDITGDKGTSHGIAQWHIGKYDRWNPFLNWAQSNNANPKDLNTQLEYVYQEAQQRGDLQKTMKAQTPEEAANIFAKNYERPAIIDKNRAKNARKLFSYQKGGTYKIPYDELVELKKAGYKFKLL